MQTKKKIKKDQPILPNISLSEKKNSFELINELNFTVIDLETTGGSHQYDKIIEIGLIKIENLKIHQELSFLVNPEIPVPDFIQKLTSINVSDLTLAPKIEDIIDEIIEFIGDSILVAHNSSFDVPFFNSVLVRLGKKSLTNKSICTDMMTKYLIPNIMNSNLIYMGKLFKIRHTIAHRALEDAKATAKLFLIYLNFFIDKKIFKINQIYYPKSKFEFDTIHFKKENDLNEILNKLINLKPPTTLLVKGEKGIIIGIYAIENGEKEIDFVKNLLLNKDWYTITIKIHGSFIESVYYMNTYLDKMKKEEISYLFDHLNSNDKEDLQNENEVIDLAKYDFLIAKHLIPEQFIVFDLNNFQKKHELIFRFPGQEKKLLQYIHSRPKNNKDKKAKKINIPKSIPEYRKLIKKLIYLDQQKEEKTYLLIPKQLNKNKKKEVEELLLHFIKNFKSNYNYPLEHL